MNVQQLEVYLGQIFTHWEGVADLQNLRYFPSWYRSLRRGATPVGDEQPWITFDAIKYLTERANSSSRVFEYGGGGSTLFFLKRCQEVVTVEHDVAWFNLLRQMIESKRISHWKGSLIEPEPGNLLSDPDDSDPDHYSSRGMPSVNFSRYVTAIDAYPDLYFDIIMIDGRARPACIKHASSKLKKGGLLVLDNADRAYYTGPKIKDVLKSYSLRLSRMSASPYVSFFTQTNIWQK